MATRSGPARWLQLRVAVDNPLPGVAHALQTRKGALVGAVEAAADGAVLHFELAVELRPSTAAGQAPGFDFFGDFVSGPRGERFVYLSIGRRAGQHHPLWERRAKLKLDAIAPSILTQAWAGEPGWAAASFAGRARDGGPLCASVRPLGSGWEWVAG